MINIYISYIFNSLESDCPTIKELSLFVLSQSDVVRSWQLLGSVLLKRDVSLLHRFRNPDAIECCRIILTEWVESPNATWSSLLRALDSINLQSAAGRIARLLPGIVISSLCNMNVRT